MAPDHEACSKGGRTTAERHGPAHMARIGRDGGKKGIRTLAAKYFDGSVGEAMRWLRSRRNELQIAALVDEKQARELTAGKAIAVEELPVLCDPDEGPCFDDPRTWRARVIASKLRRLDDLEIPY